MEVQNREGEIWHNWAQERAANGALENMVNSELYDHTWAASGYQIVNGLKLRGGERVLEAGSGWGRLIHAVKAQVPTVKIDGIELTKALSERSRALIKQHGYDAGVNITCADLLTHPLPEASYDAAYSSRVLHYIEDKRTVVEKIHKALKPSGRFMVILPNSQCPYRWLSYRHAPLYPIRDVGKLMLDAGFKNISYGGYGFFPAGLRSSHTSVVPKFDQFLANSPISRYAGLAFAIGVK